MKTLRILSVALCALILVLPSLAIPVFPSRETGDELRALALYPELTDGEGRLNRDFDAEFEAWLCDHFAFRTEAVRANARLNYALLNDSVSDRVVVGADGWLYFSDTVPDYTGEGRFTDEQLELITENLSAVAEAHVRRGARVFVAVIPNKNSVYPQHMPARYRMRDGEGNIALLKSACEALPVTWIDLETPLKAAAAGDAPVYCRTDTHWNALGAAIAADVVLEATGRGGVDYEVVGEEAFSGGDLARLMGLSGTLTERVPALSGMEAPPEADYDRPLLTVEGSGDGRLLVYRDSFGTAIAPWLTDAYSETELRWEYPLDAAPTCDDVLVLLCERNLWEYLSETPIIDETAEDDFFDPDEDVGDFHDYEEGDDFFGFSGSMTAGGIAHGI